MVECLYCGDRFIVLGSKNIWKIRFDLRPRCYIIVDYVTGKYVMCVNFVWRCLEKYLRAF